MLAVQVMLCLEGHVRDSRKIRIVAIVEMFSESPEVQIIFLQLLYLMNPVPSCYPYHRQYRRKRNFVVQSPCREPKTVRNKKTLV